MKRTFFAANRFWIGLIIATIGIILLSTQPQWVEKIYTTHIYSILSIALRALLGWVPFSLGDLLYLTAFIYSLVKIIIFIRRRNKTAAEYKSAFAKAVKTFLTIYVVFNLLWGLNYYRQGIAHQLSLKVEPYTITDLNNLIEVLRARLNSYAAAIDTADRKKKESYILMSREGVAAYREANGSFPFLAYRSLSFKPSFYSPIGHLFGFTGYYNPFTGEAQLNVTVPIFLKPFIVTHEMAHQLGYAKENEANFVGYLAARSSKDINFKYSVYFELFWYAVNELKWRKKLKTIDYSKVLHPQVIADYAALQEYWLRTRNPVEPIIAKLYNQYLKWNNQPKGSRTYNEVVAWLIAYQKKYGLESI